MSLLPQRRKTSEEIAQLRDSLGIPDIPVPPFSVEHAVPRPIAAPAEVAPAPLPQTVVLHDATANHGVDVPVAPEPGPLLLDTGRRIHTLKKSEMEPIHMPARKLETPPARRWVYSLKRSEQGPVSVPVIGHSDAPSKIPRSRHSDGELLEMKRRGLMSVRPPVPYLRSITAHPVILIFGYLLSLAGGVGGLLIALFIALRKRRSVHHAGFMAAIAGLVFVFGSLHFQELIELWLKWFPEHTPK